MTLGKISSSASSGLQINASASTDELARVCVPLRQELKALRDELFKIQDAEDATLKSYRDAETELQRLINGFKSGRDAKLEAEFETLIAETSANRSLREKIVDTDHKVFFKISEAQKKASDARFKFDGDRLLGKGIQEELERLRQRSAQLEMILEAIRAEYIGLTISEKNLMDEQKRLQRKLDEQQQQFDEMTGPYVQLRKRHDQLLNERRKREKALLRRLEAATEKRDQKQAKVAEIRQQQDEYRKKIAELQATVDELTYKRDRVNSEVEHVIAVSKRRQEQRQLFTDIIRQPELPPATEELPVIEEPVVTKESSATEEPSATKESSATEESPAAEEHSATEESPAAEEPAVTKESSTTEESPVIEEEEENKSSDSNASLNEALFI